MWCTVYLSNVIDMRRGSCCTMYSMCVCWTCACVSCVVECRLVFVCDVYSGLYSLYSLYCVVCVFACVLVCLDDSLAEWLRR